MQVGKKGSTSALVGICTIIEHCKLSNVGPMHGVLLLAYLGPLPRGDGGLDGLNVLVAFDVVVDGWARRGPRYNPWWVFRGEIVNGRGT